MPSCGERVPRLFVLGDYCGVRSVVVVVHDMMALANCVEVPSLRERDRAVLPFEDNFQQTRTLRRSLGRHYQQQTVPGDYCIVLEEICGISIFNSNAGWLWVTEE